MKAICEMTYEEACDAYSEAIIMAGDVINVTSNERTFGLIGLKQYGFMCAKIS